MVVSQNQPGTRAVTVAKEFHFLLDSAGALIVFQETAAPWASVLAFSSEDRARLNSGVESVLVKDNFRPEELVRRIRRLVQARGRDEDRKSRA